MISKKLGLVLCLVFAAFAHECIHDQVQGPTFEMEPIDTDERTLLGIGDVETHPFRIHFDTRSIATLEEPYKSIIEKQLIGFAKQFFEKRLKVRRLNGNVKFPSYKSSCYKVPLPEEHKTVGVDTDLIIYVTAENNPSASFTAWASSCMTSQDVNGRSVAGQVNFNTAYINPNAKDLSAEIATTLHEVTHILGVSGSAFKRYVDKKGVVRTDITESLNWRGMDTTILKTPKLVEVSKEHFGCSTIRGMELENQGGGGTLGSHFERTILHNEVMTGSRIALRAYSKFTFAALEDSGWFVPNYELAEPFFWGMEQGCDFIDKGCTGTNFREFCEGKGERCSFHYNSIGFCANGQMSDNCKYVLTFSNGDCRNPANADSSYYGEVYGLKSKCLNSNLLSSDYVFKGNSPSPKCYEYSCNAAHTEITVKNNQGGETVCRNEGEQATFSGFNGYIDCPNPKSFCREYYPLCPNYCSAHGHCIRGRCECIPGRGGKDCSIETNCPNGCSGKGECQDDSTCKCQRGYFGEDCSQFRCETPCVGNAKCVAPNKCKCIEGYKGLIYFSIIVGANCEQPHCNTCINGQCSSPNICTCYPGWTGSDCSTPICKNDCSGTGVCDSPNKCTCKNGYSGDDCSQILNGGGACSSKYDCSKRGFCHQNKCICWDGFSGDNCSKVVKKCQLPCKNGRCFLSFSVDSKRLISSSTPKCLCNSGWSGELCDQTCLNNCSRKTRGACYRGKCYCFSGASGPDCSQ